MSQIASDAERLFAEYRTLLFSIAYRMLGSATDAEDVVQETFVRWLQAVPAEVRSPKAFLTTVAVRLCVDQLRQARAHREVYVGPWLPEPISTEQMPELVDTAIRAESLSFAFLLLLERLGPLERAVFLLRDVFEFDYGEIAAVVGKSEANCRQILHRAQARLKDRPRFEVSREQQRRIVERFTVAAVGGNMGDLISLLADDIVYTGDGGGKAQTAMNPVTGRDRVSRGMMGGMRFLPPNVVPCFVDINGQPSIVGYVDGVPIGVVVLDVADGLVRRVYMVLNPDKLRWLAEHGDESITS